MKVKTIFVNGTLLLGKLEKKQGQFFLHDPLVIIPINEDSVNITPFGAGFVKSPLLLPNDIIIADASDYGKKQFEQAWSNIKKQVRKSIEKKMN